MMYKGVQNNIIIFNKYSERKPKKSLFSSWNLGRNHRGS